MGLLWENLYFGIFLKLIIQALEEYTTKQYKKLSFTLFFEIVKFWEVTEYVMKNPERNIHLVFFFFFFKYFWKLKFSASARPVRLVDSDAETGESIHADGWGKQQLREHQYGGTAILIYSSKI